MEIPKRLEKYIQYIKNTGGNVTAEIFIEDWFPVGEMVLRELIEMGAVGEKEGKLIVS